MIAFILRPFVNILYRKINNNEQSLVWVHLFIYKESRQSYLNSEPSYTQFYGIPIKQKQLI